MMLLCNCKRSHFPCYGFQFTSVASKLYFQGKKKQNPKKMHGQWSFESDLVQTQKSISREAFHFLRPAISKISRIHLIILLIYFPTYHVTWLTCCNILQVASSNWRRALSYVNAHRTEEEIEQFIIIDGKSMDKTPGRYVWKLLPIWILHNLLQRGGYTCNFGGGSKGDVRNTHPLPLRVQLLFAPPHLSNPRSTTNSL